LPLRPGLAEVVVVAAALAFAEKYVERLGHIDAEELVVVADQGGQRGQADSFG
jgi:hypothetical protein